MKLCGYPKIDVERELSFLNLIVVRNHDAKISVSFVIRCGVSVLLSSFALFVLKFRFGPNDCTFSKAVCVNPRNHSNENKLLTHSCKFFSSCVKFSTTRERFLTTHLVVYCHSFTRLYKLQATCKIAVRKTRFSESR